MTFQSVRPLYAAGMTKDAIDQFGDLAGDNTVNTPTIDNNAVTNAEQTTSAGPVNTITTSYDPLITDEIDIGDTVGDSDVIVIFSSELDWSMARTFTSLPSIILRVTDDLGTEVDTQFMSFWTVSDPEANLKVIGDFDKTGTYLVPTTFGTVDGIGELQDEFGFFTVVSGTDIRIDGGADYLVSATFNVDTEAGATGTVRGRIVLQDDVSGSFADNGPQWEVAVPAGEATTVHFTHYVRDMVATDLLRFRAVSDSGAANQMQIIDGSIQCLCLNRSRSQGNRIARSNVATSFLVPSANLVAGENTITVEARAGAAYAGQTVSWNDMSMVLLARKK